MGVRYLWTVGEINTAARAACIRNINLGDFPGTSSSGSTADGAPTPRSHLEISRTQ